MKKIRKIVKVGLVVVIFILGISKVYSDFGRSSNKITQSDYHYTQLRNDDLPGEDFDAFDKQIENFLSNNKIVGASVAISKEGRLIYTKGYGYANAETQEKAEPYHLFRIASVSKLVTAIAVMKLVEEGKLGLDDKVFGPNAIIGIDTSIVKDERLYNITVEHLLSHTGGWDKKNGDPILMPLAIARYLKVDAPVDIKTTIDFVARMPLDYKPGKTYSYSNFGYVVLGEVIAMKSGLPYEDYVKAKILLPLGITDMSIGKSFYHQKAKNEVKYYDFDKYNSSYVFNGTGQIVPSPYGGNCIENLGAAGGWIASSASLLKLVTSIDTDKNSPDILSKYTLDLMTQSDNEGLGPIGWRGSDGYGMWWRTGTLSGTNALLLHQRNNITWAMIVNTSVPRKRFIHNEMSMLMFKAVSSISQWPESDLFASKN